jgi:mannose-1-phosphate guanylyltransferase/mannose-6-phosphate isomerase
MADAPVRALILAGGSGTRLWPRSTNERPKPFLALTGGESLLRETFCRASALAGAGNVFVSGRAGHAALLAADLPEVTRSRLVLEPVRRNTAPAVALSALAASEDDPDTILAVLPSDQAVRDETAFLDGLRAAAEAARTHDAFVTLGIPPTRAETGFGYMEVEEHEKISAEEKEKKESISEKGKRGKEEGTGEPGISENGKRGGVPAARRVVRFVEKPTRALAEEFLASGRFFWNAGIFVFRTSLLFEEMERACPDILNIARRAHAARRADDSSTFEEISSSSSCSSLFTEIFSSSPSISFDVAVMEKARHVLTVPCACGWSDLGSWDAVFEFRGGGPGRNVLEGPAASVEGTGNLVLAEGRPVRVVGLSDVAVVDSKDGILVMRRGASDALRRSVEEGLSR